MAERSAPSVEGKTWNRLKGYDRTTHATRMAFHWADMDADREAWFVFWESSGTERECDECERPISAKEPAWVSGSTGYVLCPTCADEVELLQSGTFRESFVPDA